MLIAPNTPGPDIFIPHTRAQDVIALGLTKRNQTCPPAPLDLTVPLPIQLQMAQAQQPGAVALQSSPSTLGQATVTEGGSGATFSASDFAGAPTVLPMNLTPEMVAATNPQIQRQRARNRRKGTSGERSPGVQWGQMPSVRPGSACGPPGNWLQQLAGNPLAALLIASGLGVMVYAMATGKS